MLLVQYTFRQKSAPTLVWLDPQLDDSDEPAWAIWETSCRSYRIVYVANTDTYSPRAVRKSKMGDHTIREWLPVCEPQSTYEDAAEAVNKHWRS